MHGPGYGGVGGPVYAGYLGGFPAGGYGGYGYGHGATPAPNFIAPQPTPLGSQTIAPADYGYPMTYPASYQPMGYPAGYYPMSFYGYYGQ
jgi:hypothetical protein